MNKFSTRNSSAQLVCIKHYLIFVPLPSSAQAQCQLSFSSAGLRLALFPLNPPTCESILQVNLLLVEIQFWPAVCSKASYGLIQVCLTVVGFKVTQPNLQLTNKV